MSLTQRLAATALMLVTSLCTGGYARSDQHSDRVDSALNQLDFWLGKSANAEKWRTFLKSGDLAAQIALEDGADKAVVAGILSQYQGDAAALKRKEFAGVRTALEAWLAELSIPKIAELPAAFRAKPGFAVVAPADVEAAQTALAESAARLDKFMEAGKSAAGWKAYLNWADLEKALAATEPVDVASLEEVQLKFGSGQKGLELAPFRETAHALDAYLVKVRIAQDPEANAHYDAKLDELAAAIEAYSANYDPATADAIGEALGWLEARQAAMPLVKATRRHLSQPNILIHASEYIVGAGIERSVDEPTPIHEYILGTDISGTGRTRGSLRVELVPDARRAVFDSLFTGSTQSNTIGRNGSARIRSEGMTQFQSRKRVFITADGFYTVRATAAARTRSRPTSVSAGRGGMFANMANGIAWDRVMGSKSTAEAISAERAEARVTQRIDREGAERFAKANNNFNVKFRRPLLAKGAFPPRLDFSTTEDYLQVVGLQATPRQMGAPLPPPDLSGAPDFGLRLHESMIENLAASMLAGETIEETSFKKSMTDLFGPLDEKFESEEGQLPWEMTFARQEPVTLRIADGGYTITLRVTRFKSNNVRRVPMNITAKYTVEQVGTGFKATRVDLGDPADPNDDLAIFPPDFVPGGDATLSPEQVAMRRILFRRFSKLFEPEMVSDGLTLPGEWKKAGKLSLVQLIADKGWATVGWVKPAAPAPALTARP